MKIDNPRHIGLYRRYLLWAYKSTRESFERIERKTTQLAVDESLKKHLQGVKPDLNASHHIEYQRLLGEFNAYIDQKRKDEKEQKWSKEGQGYSAQYAYLKARLEAIEQAINQILGPNAVKEFDRLFEEEFTRRILEAKDHH